MAQQSWDLKMKEYREEMGIGPDDKVDNEIFLKWVQMENFKQQKKKEQIERLGIRKVQQLEQARAARAEKSIQRKNQWAELQDNYSKQQQQIALYQKRLQELENAQFERESEKNELTADKRMSEDDKNNQENDFNPEEEQQQGNEKKRRVESAQKEEKIEKTDEEEESSENDLNPYTLLTTVLGGLYLLITVLINYWKNPRQQSGSNTSIPSTSPATVPSHTAQLTPSTPGSTFPNVPSQLPTKSSSMELVFPKTRTFYST